MDEHIQTGGSAGTGTSGSGAADACLSSETLFLYSEGLLGLDEARQVAGHLRDCSSCQERYREEAELSVSLRGLPAPLPSPAFARAVTARIREERAGLGTPRWWWLIAAVFALTPGVVWLLISGGGIVGAPGVLTDALLTVIRAPLDLAGWLTSAAWWQAVSATVQALAEAMSSSPALLATSVMAVGILAISTNYLLWRAARSVLASQR